MTVKLELKTIWAERARKAKYRLEICETCDRYENMICKECGCVMKMKTMFPTSKCPLGKWGADKEQSQQG